MNYRGSYRKLLDNAKAAMVAAIEIYNKPIFKYRDECFIILLLNAWELALKALLSKNGQSIFYPKKRNQPYRTLSWKDALTKSEVLFPKSIPSLPVRRNLELLSTYRDNAVHFYNEKGFGILVCALAQTSIIIFKDLLAEAFDAKIEEEVNWQLLPLGFSTPIDPIAYISEKTNREKPTRAVKQYLSELAESVDEVQRNNYDTGRLLTVFSVKLESTKKIERADVVVGLEGVVKSGGPLAIVKTQDPNITHPLRQKDIVDTIASLHGFNFTSHVFQAIVWKYNLKEKAEYCWQAEEGVLTKYSRDVIAWVKRLTKADIEDALKDYKSHLRAKRERSN
ncbi:MAG: DUF3644 domain-containing protein [Nitrospirota bacterium]